MTSAKAFVDTNVLLRAIHTSMPLHTEAELLITTARQNDYELWVSRQVIREYIAQVTRPGLLAHPLDAAQIRAKVNTIRATFRVADETDVVTDKLLELLEEFSTGGKQVHDANIVATMLVYNIDVLLTQNVDDLKRFASKISIRPLIANAP